MLCVVLTLHFRQALADEAAKLVVVTYSDVQKPILTFEDAIAADSFYENRRVDLQIGTPEIAMQSADVVIEGQASVGHQYHFHLETQRAICIPGEDNSMDVYSSTQNPSQVQHCVGVGLNQPQHKITVSEKCANVFFFLSPVVLYSEKTLGESFPLTAACFLSLVEHHIFTQSIIILLFCNYCTLFFSLLKSGDFPH
jgi:CO/xanthine dehydrogenase Mo-binding subunit